MQANISPTKSNYLKVQERLSRAQEAHHLLEEKRQILVIQLMNRVEAARRVKQEVEEALAEAYRQLREASIHYGTEYLERQGFGIEMKHHLHIKTYSVMGISVPQITCKCAPHGVQFGLSDGGSKTDEVMKNFLEALHRIAELAEVENAVFRLARELKGTQRRVRALEKTFIPDYKDALKCISESLEERERENLTIMKKVKRSRHAASDASAQGRRGRA